MRLSVRNQLTGKVASIQPGSVMTIVKVTLDGGQSHATGSNFYALRHWTDAQWQAAREAIRAQNEKDRAQRSV